MAEQYEPPKITRTESLQNRPSEAESSLSKYSKGVCGNKGKSVADRVDELLTQPAGDHPARRPLTPEQRAAVDAAEIASAELSNAALRAFPDPYNGDPTFEARRLLLQCAQDYAVRMRKIAILARAGVQ